MRLKSTGFFLAMVIFTYARTAYGLEAGCSLLHLMNAHEKAITKCTKEATEGRADAARILSNIYKNGNGVPPNTAEADKWEKLANQLEDANAKFRASAITVEQHWAVCQSVYAGRGDHENTLYSCQKAAETGHLQAQRELAQRYALGYGVPQAPSVAAKWYQMAAEQGDSDSQYELAKRYCTFEISGIFAKRDQEKWYMAAAKQGHVLAQYELATLYFNQGATRQDDARKWYELVAEDGAHQVPKSYLFEDIDLAFEGERGAVVQSQYQLGVIHLGGLGTVQDYSEALRWFRKAAEHGHMGAQLELGQMYATGQGTVTNKVLAHMWLNLAATGAYGVSNAARNARDGLTRKMTPAEIKRAQQLARKWSETMRR
jgi:uncharacterized protein